MNNRVKGTLLALGAYGAAMLAVILIVVLAVITLSGPHSCSAMRSALLALWGTIAVVFLASAAAVGAAAWKIFPEASGRAAVMILYGLALLASYVVIAFGLMVFFNC
jgi:hypothetical protein